MSTHGNNTTKNTGPGETRDAVGGHVVASGQNVVGDTVADLEALRARVMPGWVKILGVLLLILLVGCVTFFLGKTSAGGGGSHVEAQQVSRSLTGKTIDEDKKDALNSLVKLLNEAGTDGGDYQARAKSIEGGDYSSLPAGWRDKMVSAEDKGKVAGWEALIILNGGMKQYLKTTGELKPAGENAVNYVVVNQETGVAHIPGSVLLGSDVPLSFDMVFVDGQWRLDPYNVVQDILNSAAAGARAGATPGVSPSAKQ